MRLPGRETADRAAPLALPAGALRVARVRARSGALTQAVHRAALACARARQPAADAPRVAPAPSALGSP